MNVFSRSCHLYHTILMFSFYSFITILMNKKSIIFLSHIFLHPFFQVTIISKNKILKIYQLSREMRQLWQFDTHRVLTLISRQLIKCSSLRKDTDITLTSLLYALYFFQFCSRRSIIHAVDWRFWIETSLKK